MEGSFPTDLGAWLHTQKQSGGLLNSAMLRTVPAIKKLLESRHIFVSEYHSRFLRNQLGFKRKAAKYCQLIRDANKERRLQFCLDMEASNETSIDCVFTDKSTIQVDCSVKYCYMRNGDYLKDARKNVRNLEQLRDAVLKFWLSLTPEICARYDHDIPKKMRHVIQAQGGNIYEGK
ncbi:hypothetical protein Aduo_016681 [Ancylostoma duodenale]